VLVPFLFINGEMHVSSGRMLLTCRITGDSSVAGRHLTILYSR